MYVLQRKALLLQHWFFRLKLTVQLRKQDVSSVTAEKLHTNTSTMVEQESSGGKTVELTVQHLNFEVSNPELLTLQEIKSQLSKEQTPAFRLQEETPTPQVAEECDSMSDLVNLEVKTSEKNNNPQNIASQPTLDIP